jgi:hypothetical protein
MCLRFVFLLITQLAAWLRLSRRQETWKTAEILILRHQPTTVKHFSRGRPCPRLPAQTGRRAIPRISHDQRQTAAPGGIWLHTAETNQGRRSAPELLIRLVAGVGFEPT